MKYRREGGGNLDMRNMKDMREGRENYGIFLEERQGKFWMGLIRLMGLWRG
jgi:hypothetical protein